MALVISGHARSGTTLLRHLCDWHPAMRVTGEVGSFLPMLKRFAAHRRHILERLRVVGNSHSFSRSHCNLMFVTRYLVAAYKFRRQAMDLASVEAVLRRMYPGARIVGDKWSTYMDRLDTLVPMDGLRVVIIYRDCRDVVSSTLKRVRADWRRSPFAKEIDSAEKVAQRWVGTIESMERHQEKLHTMRYENLVQDPMVELERLSHWLDVDPWRFPFKMIRDTSVGKHAKALSPAELETVMDVAGPTMARLGYV